MGLSITLAQGSARRTCRASSPAARSGRSRRAGRAAERRGHVEQLGCATPTRAIREPLALTFSHHKECSLWVKGRHDADPLQKRLKLVCGNSANRFLVRVFNCLLSALCSCATCRGAIFSCLRRVSSDLAGCEYSAPKFAVLISGCDGEIRLDLGNPTNCDVTIGELLKDSSSLDQSSKPRRGAPAIKK